MSILLVRGVVQVHDIFTIGLPLLAILAGILLNRQDVSSLRSEIGSLRTEMHTEIRNLRSEINARLDSIQRDMREFYAEQARHDIRISRLEQAE